MSGKDVLRNVDTVCDEIVPEQYVAIFGDQSETQQCYGPFADLDALFDFAHASGVAEERVSFYKICAPNSAPTLTLRDAIAEFPATFGLRGFPGVFRISPSSSYVNDSGTIMLYTERLIGGSWQSFAKGTAHELRTQIVKSRD